MRYKSKRNTVVARVFFCALVVILSNTVAIDAQTVPNNISLNKKAAKIKKDSLLIAQVDSSKTDTLNPKIFFSKDSLDAPVDYSAKDSIIFDNAENKVYLYGSAQVKYTNITLTAQFITVDLKNSVAEAVPLPDSSGKMRGIPRFKDPEQDFTINKLRYNFKTRKGLAFDVTTKQKDVYIHGGISKFVSTPEDSINKKQDIAYSQGAVFTTCDAPHPHYGIVSQKQKVVAGKLIVVGFSQLYIGDVPTPLVLPFGFFPLFKGAHTGLIFPKDYATDVRGDFGLNNIGWYFPISEQYDLQLTGDAYVLGTFGLRAKTDYVKRYNYQGSLELSMRSQKTEDAFANTSRANSYNIRWQHSKDSRVNPTVSFGASVGLSFSASKAPLLTNLNGAVTNNYQTVTQSSLNSSVNFTKQFPGKPYSFSASFTHSQNVYTRDFSVTFPNLNFQLQTIYPFKRKNLVGVEQWFEKLAFQYQGQFNGRINTKDSLLFTEKMWQSALTGVNHKLSASVNFSIWKYFNLSPSINYEENWYVRQQQRTFDAKNIIVKKDSTPIITTRGDTLYDIKSDTTQYGKVDTNYQNGFFRVYNVSTNLSLNTRLFGNLNFKKGWLRGIRHTLAPTFSLYYTPDTRRYLDSTLTDLRTPLQKLIYNRYENSLYGTPSASGASAGFSYGFSNLFEYKSFDKKDSTFHKGHLLFDNISVGGSFNAIADSFNFSLVSMSTGTNLFKGLSNISINAIFDPYGRDNRGIRTQRFALQQNGQLLNFQQMNLSVNTRLSVQQIRSFFEPKKEGGELTTTKAPTGTGPQFESLWDFFGAFALNHYFAVNVVRPDGATKDTLTFQHTINTSGNFPLSKRWRLTLSNIGYDFTTERITYPDLTFTTDLHCWEMGLGWQPLRNTYQFFLRVKPGSLDFLKLPYNKVY